MPILSATADRAKSTGTSFVTVFLVCAVAVGIAASTPTWAQEEELKAGQAIYAASCASCHGPTGEGVPDKYDEPLVGDATIGELAALISETMPEDDPGSCVADDAQAVAAYIHHTFYSAAARLRNRPPRIELARLTAEQLRQSYADLYTKFFDAPWMDERRGLEGHYFNGKRWDEKKKQFTRVDPTIDFDFGEHGPGDNGSKKQVDAKEYYILWNGSLKVDQTGRYQIMLRSSCSCSMSFGHPDRELIDNHVQSAGREEFRETMHLTAGRVYPLKIQFTQRKRKTKQPPAKISLSWKPPSGVEQVIPTQYLIPSEYPATYALQTKLPPDDRSYGYERGTDINRQWDESTTNAAFEFAQIAVDELWPRYQKKNRNEKKTGRESLRKFLEQLAETAFRGPLDDAQRNALVERSIELHEDDAEAIKRCVLLTLKSPRFLYPTLDSDRSKSQRNANRLALTLYDSLPVDEWLIKQVAKNQLQTEKQVRETAYRMINDYRAHAKVQSLFHEWLDIAHVSEITKDQERYPQFDRPLVADLRESLDRFVEDVVWSEKSDFRELFTADWTYTTDRLAQFYGPSWQVADEPTKQEPTKQDSEAHDDQLSLRRSVADPEHRRGILTHPLLLSHLAYHQTSSPVHRGVFLVRHVLGRTLRPPNAAFSPLNPDLHPGLTTRQRVELQTNEENCQVCHARINSLGFALEDYDAAGRFREQENSLPINAQGSYVDRLGKDASFNGAAELAEYLTNSRDCHQAFVEAAFEHMVKQPIAAYGPHLSEQLTDQFVKSGFNIRALLVEIAVASTNL